MRGRLLGAVRVLRSEREGLREHLLLAAFVLGLFAGLCFEVEAMPRTVGVLSLFGSLLSALGLLALSLPQYRLFSVAGGLMAFRALAALTLPDVAYGYVSGLYLVMFLTVLVRLLWLEDKRMLFLMFAAMPLPGLN